MKEKIIRYANQIGIDEIGFTDSFMPDKLRKKLNLQQTLGYACSFQKGEVEEKMNPQLLLDSCQTIIAVLISYSKSCLELENLKANEVYFSSSSWGLDYHDVLRNKLNKLINYIKEEVPDLEAKIIVDTSPLCDRTIAYKAGLGFFGKNNLLINEKYGSYIFLGAILTNLILEKDKPLNKQCFDCNKCIIACPTKALNKHGILDSSKCLAYITQKKGVLTEKEKEHMNQCIYGCDICMRICPYNKNNNNYHQEFKPTGIEFINIDTFAPLTNKQFKLKYGHLSGAWRGGKIINRNIEIYKDKCK